MNDPSPAGPVELAVRPRRVLLWVFGFCVLAEISFFLLDWHVNYGRMTDAAPIRNLFNTTREDGLASWFGVTQTAFIALTLWLIFVTTRARRQGRWIVLGWLALALFFSYMAFDDGAEFHERIGSTFKLMQTEAGDDGVLKIFPSYPWQVIFVPIFGAAGVFMLVFLWRQLGERFARLLVVAGIGCLAFAVGIDFIEGLDRDHPYNVNAMIADLPAVDEYMDERFGRRNSYTAVRHFGKSLEETIEMFAMTLLWIAFLRYWMHIAREFRIRFD